MPTISEETQQETTAKQGLALPEIIQHLQEKQKENEQLITDIGRAIQDLSNASLSISLDSLKKRKMLNEEFQLAVEIGFQKQLDFFVSELFFLGELEKFLNELYQALLKNEQDQEALDNLQKLTALLENQKLLQEYLMVLRSLLLLQEGILKLQEELKETYIDLGQTIRKIFDAMLDPNDPEIVIEELGGLKIKYNEIIAEVGAILAGKIERGEIRAINISHNEISNIVIETLNLRSPDIAKVGNHNWEKICSEKIFSTLTSNQQYNEMVEKACSMEIQLDNKVKEYRTISPVILAWSSKATSKNDSLFPANNTPVGNTQNRPSSRTLITSNPNKNYLLSNHKNDNKMEDPEAEGAPTHSRKI